MFPAPIARQIAQRFAVVVAALWAGAGMSAAWALDPSLDVSQNGHRAWRNLDGFGLGTIVAMTQTTDGYIWLATPNGVLRFDGARSVPWRAPPGATLPDMRVRALRGTPDGALWIGTLRGLARLEQGVLVVYPSLMGKAVNAIEEGSDGTIWVGGSGGDVAFLCAIRAGASECHGDDGSLGRTVTGLYRDGLNRLWVAGTDRVWKWGPQPMASYALPSPIVSIGTLTGTLDGAVVVGTRHHVVTLADGKVEELPLRGRTGALSYGKVLRDSGGALWLAVADSGLLHLHEGRVDTFTMAQGLSGNNILALFEDRQGNVWVSTTRGLDQFRPLAAVPQARTHGLTGRARSVFSARDGSMWAGTTTGLYERNRSGVWERRSPEASSLFEDRRGRIWTTSRSGLGYFDGGRFVAATSIPAGPVDAIAEDSKGTIWVAHRGAGLFRLPPDGTVKHTPWANVGVSARVSTMTVDPINDSLWLGMWSGAVVNVHEGQIRTLPELPDASSSPRINQLRAESNGTLWIANVAGLTRIRGDHVSRLDTRSGLPCDHVFWTLVDAHSVWISAPCGLMRVDRAEIDAWAAAADQGLPARVKVRWLDNWDGVIQPVPLNTLGQFALNFNFTPKLTRSPDGRIWAVSEDLVTVDPERIPVSPVPPQVHVESLVSDGKTYEPRSSMRLPPLQKNLAIDYTGLNFPVPERLQFRYKLEGRDKDWQDAGNRRQAFYTDLPPGSYLFRVTASNEHGLRAPEGATLMFSIEPAWWQANIFRAACVAGTALVLYGLYQLRIARLSRMLASEVATSQENARLYRDLREREARVRRLFNSNIIGIFTWNLDGRILEANHAFGEIIGYCTEDFASGQMRWRDLMPAEWNEDNDRIMTVLRASNIAPPFEAEYVRKDGSRVPVLIGAALFDGMPTEGVAFVLDLTARKQAEEAARDNELRCHDLVMQLSDANRVASIGQLSASIAHEINQPLAGIIINASAGLRMLEADPPNIEGSRETARRLVRDSDRAANVITRLRALFSKKESTLEPMDLNEATREVIAMTRNDLERNRVVVSSQLADDLPSVSGDRIQLQQVIFNLVRNASDAMRDIHDRRRHLTVKTERDGDDRVRVTVRDAGSGLDRESMGRLFDAFYTTKTGGMGIGLSVSRSIIQRHHGRLWAEPNDDLGAAFMFSIPHHPDSASISSG